jgi:hypothetical protein
MEMGSELDSPRQGCGGNRWGQISIFHGELPASMGSDLDSRIARYRWSVENRDLTPHRRRGYDASAVIPRFEVPMLWTTSARSRENAVDPPISSAICSSSRAAAAVPSIAAR